MDGIGRPKPRPRHYCLAALPINGEIMSDKTEKIKKKLDAQKSALDILQSLNGKHIDLMSKAEQEALLIALAQLAGVANENNEIVVN